jgi:hypothetical protein
MTSWNESGKEILPTLQAFGAIIFTLRPNEIPLQRLGGCFYLKLNIFIRCFLRFTIHISPLLLLT